MYVYMQSSLYFPQHFQNNLYNHYFQDVYKRQEHREPVIIPHFSCHVLRHTFCSRLCESDMNVKVIQEIMGHKNVETTLDIYTEVNYNKKKDSLEELASKMQFF